MGLINTGFGLAIIYAFLYFADASDLVANAAGYAVGFFISFALNRAWTFRSSSPYRQALPKYLILTLVAYGANLAVVIAAHRYFGIDVYVAQLLGVVIYSVMTFVGSRWLVFATPSPRKSKNDDLLY